MMKFGRMAALGIVVAALSTAWGFMPTAHAADVVTYEIVSEHISVVDVEYVDQTGRKLLTGVRLPWRLDVTLDDARASGHGAQIRADWRPAAGPGKWVVTTIFRNGTPICQNTIDVGNVACYGNTPIIIGYLDPKTVPLPE